MQELKEALEAATSWKATVSGNSVKVTLDQIETKTFYAIKDIVEVFRVKIEIKRSGKGLTVILSK